MIRFTRNNKAKKEDQELRNLAKSLANEALKPDLDSELQVGMKKHLLAQIRSKQVDLLPESLEKVGLDLRVQAREAVLNQYRKVGLKESILDSIQTVIPRYGFLPRFQGAIAGVLIFVISFVSLVFYPVDVTITKAAKWTFIESIQGEVYVSREGNLMGVNENFALQEGDIVITKSDSFVVIRYLDDSVTRLSENSLLKLNKLFALPENTTETEVQVILEHGKAWTKVTNLVGEDSSFVMETDFAKAKVKDKAAFEVSKEGLSTSVAVFENVVDVSKKSGALERTQPVITGFVAQVADDQNVVTLTDHESVIAEEGNAEWTEMNLNLDQEQEEKIKDQAIKSNNEVLGGKNDFLTALSDFQDLTKSIFVDPQLERLRKDFVQAHLGFIEAQNLLNSASSDNQNRTESLKYLRDYLSTVENILAQMPELKEQNAERADLLLKLIKENVEVQKKNLAVVLPRENLYLVKDYIYQVSGLLAEGQLDQIEAKLEAARNKLQEVEALINRNQLKLAQSTFKQYLDQLDQLVEFVNESDVKGVKTKLFELIREQLNQLKKLNAIEKQLKYKDEQQFLNIVQNVKMSSINKLIEIFEGYQNQAIPFELLQELYSLVDLYLYDANLEYETLVEIDKLMREYPEYKILVEEKTLLEMQNVMVDQESTADVKSAVRIDFEVDI